MDPESAGQYFESRRRRNPDGCRSDRAPGSKVSISGEFVSDTGTVKSAFELMAEPESGRTQEELTNGANLRWEEDALLFTYADGELKISFRYELMDSARRLRAVEVLRGKGRTQDNIWIFDRR